MSDASRKNNNILFFIVLDTIVFKDSRQHSEGLTFISEVQLGLLKLDHSLLPLLCFFFNHFVFLMSYQLRRLSWNDPDEARQEQLEKPDSLSDVDVEIQFIYFYISSLYIYKSQNVTYHRHK